MDMAHTEDWLISLAANGDLEAFNQLVLKYQGMAYRHAFAIMGDPEDAEDITQESLIKAFQNIKAFRGGSFRAWLLKIVTNNSYDLLRNIKMHATTHLFPKGRDEEETDSPKWLRDPAPSVEAQVQGKEESLQLQKMLDELPAVYRSIIALIDVDELDYAEAAIILQIPLGTVKSRLTRARLKIIAKLQAACPPTPWPKEGMPAT